MLLLLGTRSGAGSMSWRIFSSEEEEGPPPAMGVENLLTRVFMLEEKNGVGERVGVNPTELENRMGAPGGFQKVKLDPTECLILIL